MLDQSGKAWEPGRHYALSDPTGPGFLALKTHFPETPDPNKGLTVPLDSHPCLSPSSKDSPS